MRSGSHLSSPSSCWQPALPWLSSTTTIRPRLHRNPHPWLPKKESPTSGNKVLVSLGDSLTRGTGDITGKGYVGRVQRRDETVYGDQVTAVNLGVNGQTSADLAKQTRQREVRQLLKRATWITVTVGGNDLFRSSGGPEQVDRVAIDKGRALYRRNLSRLLKEIRELNSEAPVFIYGLYNPFGDLSGQQRNQSPGDGME